MIDCANLSKSYGRDIYALRDFTLTIDKGEFLFLTGPSGAGKSTLLRLLLREELPSAGTLRVLGRNLADMKPAEIQSYRRTLGFVFQDFRLVPRFTVFQNVSFVMRVLGVEPMEQQRVAIARALVNDPQIVVADEPTGNLDPDLARDVMNLFREANAKGTTVIIATHDREMIRHVNRRAVTLDHGRIVSVA